MTYAHGTCLGASLVCISVCAVADDSPVNDEIGPAAEGVCHWDSHVCTICERLCSYDCKSLVLAERLRWPPLDLRVLSLSPCGTVK